MLPKLLIAAAVLIAGFLVYVALQPSAYNISRETLVKASPNAIFPYLNNSHKTNDWMPWAAMDPQMKMSYSGPDDGVGSTSNWDSPGKMGTGQAVVVESVPNKVVKTQLTYTKPMTGVQLAEISLTPASEGTLVRWSVSGENNFVGRIFCTFMNMDKTLGGMFEQGLTKLKGQVEGAH